MLKFVLFVLVIGGGLVGGSYAGARFAAGKVIGPQPPAEIGTAKTRFAYEGIEKLPGKPRAWIVTYGPTRIPGVRRIEIYVSVTGQLIATQPKDVEAIIAPFRPQEP
jgi:hypothetical protein